MLAVVLSAAGQQFLATACPVSATQPTAAAVLLPLHIHMCVCVSVVFATAGFLFFKGVNAANEAAERQDRMDGYIK